ncbi:MAG: hypothetical protein ACRCZF_01785 [Gemmataceae bacterium]
MSEINSQDHSDKRRRAVWAAMDKAVDLARLELPKIELSLKGSDFKGHILFDSAPITPTQQDNSGK